tara:strand:- start:71 stop:703 length:633 start_codon:yes stop_codon:yes gene_type:complete
MSIKLNASSGGSVALDAPTQTTSSADLTFKLPVADGSANHVLKTDGSANLSFAEAVGKIRKYATFTHDGYVTGNYEGNPNNQAHGYELINTSYTPAAADSTIVLLSSSVTIGEGTNHLNNFWLSAWEGSNFISAVSGGARYTSYANYYNETTLSYIGTFTSGSTNARNIMFRTGGNDTANTATVYINGNPNGSYSGNQNRFTVFLVELAP